MTAARPGLPLALSLAISLAACGRAGAEEPEPPREAVLAALIGGAATPLADATDCEAGYAQAPLVTLGDDVAAHLALVDTGGGTVSAECWPPEPGGRTCTVGLGRDLGEEVWTRVYRFTLDADGQMVPGSLFCTTIP